GEDTRILVEVEHKNKIVSAQWYTLNKEQKLLTFPVTEAHRGNFAIHLVCVKGNRFYSGNVNVYVPYTDKQLDIEIESFRDKLQPGEGEKWKIIIKNAKGEKELAELMAGMYDASLDAYKSHSWYLNLLSYYYGNRSWDAASNFTTKYSYQYSLAYSRKYYNQMIYTPKLRWFNYPLYSYNSYYYSYDDEDYGDIGVLSCCQTAATGTTREKASAKKDAPAAMDVLEAEEMLMSDGEVDKDAEVTKAGLLAGNDMRNEQGGEGVNMNDIAVRTNFNETAFFFPQLRTNENGETVIEFTMPESLTKWKFMGLAHTKDLKMGSITKNLVTQKTLMINSFAPRFLREGDKIIFTSKISNLSETDMDGTVMLELIDALTGMSVADKFGLTSNSLTFNVKKGQSTKIAWELSIPYGIGAVTYRIKAKSGAFTDGEEMSIPVLSNRMLVTESLPLPIRGNETKNYTFDKLVNSGSSKTLVSHRYTLEFTSNPAWYAVQALPYIIEYPYECVEQTFSRYYANTIATFIANSYPKIREVFDTWKNLTPESFLSNLEKNEELKSLVLEETPWVLDAQNESERKKRVGLLFDLNRMAKEQRKAENLLVKYQSPNGGFPWYKGMPDDRYITQHIVSGFGKLDHLGIRDIKENSRISNMISKAVYYLDDRIREDLNYIKKHYPKYKTEQHISYIQVHYLYARSFFLNYEISERNKEAFDYFFAQAKTYWTSFSTYGRGMIALGLNRYSEKTIPADIVKSLKETSLHSDEMGMYWREFAGGYYWWEAPIESQALMVEVFSEVANDATAVEELKIWLLKQKQVQDWKSTKATVDAVYALLIRGFNLLTSDKIVEVKIGNEVIDPFKIDNCKVEAGTGYFKTAWSGDQVKPEMGNIQVTKSDSGIAWGAVYWQYFEDLDKITPHETPISIKKQLFVERQSPTGPRMEPIGDNATLKVGDKVKVRIEIRVDREMEYVHMKDMRASCMEPVNVMSTTKYQGGLWYFENTRDAATNFFFNNLYKGTYVFEYSLFATHAGEFSNGITTIQCMYAPEFTSHSEGIRVKVVE
ncbi:MAG TPA: alpha-2-macroglobulin family protein, partial [Bacteroidales bacterium]|nr:alpha-2-macroglobulin family protein [Bacteroidales bacterium]